jgi:hypothetical protein
MRDRQDTDKRRKHMAHMDDMRIDPMPRQDLQLPPPVGFVPRAEYDAQAAELTRLRNGGISEPVEPGGFVGDIYYGDPERTTFGTHRWNGSEWVNLPSEMESVLAMLADARKELTRLRARIEAADKLAELGWRAKHGFHVNNDELAAALSAYEGTRK